MDSLGRHRYLRYGRVLAWMLPVAMVPLLLATGAASASSYPAHVVTPKPLVGKIVGIDPGHNGLNWAHPGYINRQIWNGREWENCDTTGTQTASGYTEARFNFNVARYLRADLIRAGLAVPGRAGRYSGR